MHRRALVGLIAGLAATVVASALPPDSAVSLFAPLLPLLALLAEAAYRAWYDFASIVLEALPFVLFGACAAALVRSRVSSGAARKGARVAALFSAITPACDCAMNGFAQALKRGPAPLAGFSLMWGACCGPVALLLTHAILGNRLLLARVAGGLTAACLTALFWFAMDRLRTRPGPDHDCSGRALARPGPSCARPLHQRWAPSRWRRRLKIDRDIELHSNGWRPTVALVKDFFASGITALLPAAAASSLLLAVFPGGLRGYATPIATAALAAIMSPCSTSDALLARVLATSQTAQAAFVIAAQCFDLRQLALLRRNFGTPRMLAGVAAALAGCAVAVRIAAPQ